MCFPKKHTIHLFKDVENKEITSLEYFMYQSQFANAKNNNKLKKIIIQFLSLLIPVKAWRKYFRSKYK